MAINKKPFAVKGIGIATPKGKALWCKVNEPDTKFNAKGDLTTSLVLDPNEPAVDAFIKKVEALRDTAVAETQETLGAKAKNIIVKDVFDYEVDQNGEETGNILIKAKLSNVEDRKAQGRKAKIDVVDAKKQIIEEVPNVGNGSIVRLFVYANPYYMAATKQVGVSLMWQKLQIIELVDYSAGGDEFDEEDGYTSTTKVEEWGEEDF